VQIDWFTTVAQIANFLILVYLLKRFLYRPILAAVARREEQITRHLVDAEELQALAAARHEEYEEKISAFDRQRDELLDRAERDAESRRLRMLEQLREETAETRARWLEEIGREQHAFLAQARRAVGEQVCQVARQALRDLANADLEEQMSSVLVAQLRDLDSSEKSRLARRAAGRRVTVQSRYALSSRERERITAAIHGEIDPALAIEFSEVADLVCGINIKGLGFKLQWDLASYLGNVDEQLSSHLALENPGDPPSVPRSTPC
jgi:F-type H+-transporting ATPase subunit b